MKALGRRIGTLEAAQPRRGLHPALKQWLGIELTDAEKVEARNYVPPDDVDPNEFSQEVREWLGLG